MFLLLEVAAVTPGDLVDLREEAVLRTLSLVEDFAEDVLRAVPDLGEADLELLLPVLEAALRPVAVFLLDLGVAIDFVLRLMKK